MWPQWSRRKRKKAGTGPGRINQSVETQQASALLRDTLQTIIALEGSGRSLWMYSKFWLSKSKVQPNGQAVVYRHVVNLINWILTMAI